jgi:ribose transport system permease protein
MKTMTRRKGRTFYKQQWFILMVVIVAMAAATGIANPKFFSVRNLVNILEQISTLGLVASGATVLMISGNFDISVGSTIGLSACAMAMLMKRDVAEPLAVAAGLGVAILCCLFIGANSLLFKAPSFIISLACVGIYRGIALALTGGTIQTIYGKFEYLGSTRYCGVLPLLFIVSLVGYLAVHFILARTRLGRRVYAIGSNRNAAFLSGIAINRNLMTFFLINGILVGAAAALLLSRVGAVQPATGAGMELRAMGAVVIGGAPMTGGKGNILGTFTGVLLMGVISNVLNMLQVSPYFQDITFGLLIIVSLAISAMSQKWQK